MEKLINADFFLRENNQFYARVLTTFNYKTKKPIVFLPCAKTKPYSKSLTHSYLSAITRDPNLQKIVISEPLAVVPYELENEIPYYNFPPKALNKWDRMMFVQRVGIFLYQLKQENPEIEKIYYIGGRHHYEILKEANGGDLRLTAIIPPRGIRDYAKCAKALHEVIYSENIITKKKQSKLI